MDISLIHDASKFRMMMEAMEPDAHGISAHINMNEKEITEQYLWRLLDHTRDLRKHLLKMLTTATGLPESIDVDGIIFMGNGSASAYQCEKLHEQLEEAFSTMSGMQQGGDDPDGSGRKLIEKTAQDIALGLTGKRLSLRKTK